jgi:hypothetical protein
MPYTAETNRRKQSEHYYENKDEKLRKGVLERIMKGIRVKDETLRKYDIKLSEITDKNKINKEVLLTLTIPDVTIGETIDESIDNSFLENVYDEFILNSGLSESTLKTYTSHLKALKKLLTPNSTNMEFYKTLTDSKKCIPLIKAKYPQSYGSYISPILSLAKYSVEFKEFLCQSLVDYQNAYDEHKKDTKLLLLKKMDTENVVKWEDLILLREKIAKEDLYSQRHLLISLMTMIPTLRDDWGSMRICKKTPIFAKTGPKQNYYNQTEGKIYLYKYKGCARKGVKIINVPTELQKIIDGSLKKNPREWMVTKYDNMKTDKYARDQLSELIKNKLGYTINEFRHSLATYIYKNPSLKPSQILAINEGMLHSSAMGLMYVRDGEISKD